MKKTTLLILAFCAGMLSARTQTVVTASTETEYPQEMGKNVRICINESDGATVIFYRDVNTGKNWFIYHKPAATTENKYLWPDIPEGTGYADCTVEDMKIIKDTLYFCGVSTFPVGNVYRKKGYIGWVIISELAASSGTVQFYYCSEFNENQYPFIVGLTHMDGIHDPTYMGYTKLGLVGSAVNPNNDTTSSLLLVKNNGSNNWVYQFHYLTDTKETLTDITFVGKILVVPSRFNHEYEDHYRFGIRHERLDFAFDMQAFPSIPYFQNVYKFNTRNMYTATSVSPYPTWHRNDVAMHVTPNPFNIYQVIVAYECEDTAQDCENSQLTALYQVDVPIAPPSFSIASGQLVHGYFRKPYTFVGFQNVTIDSTMALLYQGNDEVAGIASVALFPSWYHYGQIDGFLADYRGNTSLDVYKDRYVRFGGTSTLNGNVIHYQIDRPNSRSSCYSSRPAFSSEELLNKSTLKVENESLESTRECSVTWRPFTMTRKSAPKNISCESFNKVNP